MSEPTELLATFFAQVRHEGDPNLGELLELDAIYKCVYDANRVALTLTDAELLANQAVIERVLVAPAPPPQAGAELELIKCPDCNGRGSISGAPGRFGLRMCLACSGTGKEQYLREANAPDETDAADFLEAEMKKSYEANYQVRDKNNRPLHLKKWMFDKFVQIMQSYASHIAAKAVEDRDKELTRLVDEAHKDAEQRRDEATVNLEVHHQQGEMLAYKQVRAWLNPTV